MHIKNHNINFEFIAKIPPNNYVHKIDSINYVLRIKNDNGNYYDLYNSNYIVHDSITSQHIIFHRETIQTTLELKKDTLILFLSRRINNDGHYMNSDEFEVGIIINQ